MLSVLKVTKENPMFQLCVRQGKLKKTTVMKIIFTSGIGKLTTETHNTFKYATQNVMFRTDSETEH